MSWLVFIIVGTMIVVYIAIGTLISIWIDNLEPKMKEDSFKVVFTWPLLVSVILAIWVKRKI